VCSFLLFRNRDYFCPSTQPFDLLLLVIFSLAAQMIPSETVSKVALGLVIPDVGSRYFEHAKHVFGALIFVLRECVTVITLIGHSESMYKLSHPTICVSLLLLGYREFGMGNVPQAWLFTGLSPTAVLLDIS